MAKHVAISAPAICCRFVCGGAATTGLTLEAGWQGGTRISEGWGEGLGLGGWECSQRERASDAEAQHRALERKFVAEMHSSAGARDAAAQVHLGSL